MNDTPYSNDKVYGGSENDNITVALALRVVIFTISMVKLALITSRWCSHCIHKWWY